MTHTYSSLSVAIVRLKRQYLAAEESEAQDSALITWFLSAFTFFKRDSLVTQDDLLRKDGLVFTDASSILEVFEDPKSFIFRFFC